MHWWIHVSKTKLSREFSNLAFRWSRVVCLREHVFNGFVSTKHSSLYDNAPRIKSTIFPLWLNLVTVDPLPVGWLLACFVSNQILSACWFTPTLGFFVNCYHSVHPIVDETESKRLVCYVWGRNREQVNRRFHSERARIDYWHMPDYWMKTFYRNSANNQESLLWLYSILSKWYPCWKFLVWVYLFTYTHTLRKGHILLNDSASLICRK